MVRQGSAARRASFSRSFGWKSDTSAEPQQRNPSKSALLAFSESEGQENSGEFSFNLATVSSMNQSTLEVKNRFHAKEHVRVTPDNYLHFPQVFLLKQFCSVSV